MPISNSQLAQDILLCVLDSHLKEKSLSVKELFASLPYSTMGIRNHFDRLVQDGWLELHNGSKDKRIKHVMPSKQLIEQFDKLCQYLIENKVIHISP